jgi:hypothetical protein
MTQGGAEAVDSESTGFPVLPFLFLNKEEAIWRDLEDVQINFMMSLSSCRISHDIAQLHIHRTIKDYARLIQTAEYVADLKR